MNGTILDIKYDPLTGQPIYRARASHACKGSEWHKSLETNGSTCYFIDADPDTGKVGITEMYDENAGEWVEQPSGGGGGGDSTDFLTDDDIENAWG